MSWLKDNGYKTVKEFVTDYVHNNSHTFAWWAEKEQHKHLPKENEKFSYGYYHGFGIAMFSNKYDEQIANNIKILFPIWKKEKLLNENKA